MMHLSGEERRLFVRFLTRAIKLDGEHTLAMLVGDESDFGTITGSYEQAVEVRDALCKHWDCPPSTDNYGGQFICVDCGEEFDDVADLNHRSEVTRLSDGTKWSDREGGTGDSP